MWNRLLLTLVPFWLIKFIKAWQIFKWIWLLKCVFLLCLYSNGCNAFTNKSSHAIGHDSHSPSTRGQCSSFTIFHVQIWCTEAQWSSPVVRLSFYHHKADKHPLQKMIAHITNTFGECVVSGICRWDRGAHGSPYEGKCSREGSKWPCENRQPVPVSAMEE